MNSFLLALLLASASAFAPSPTNFASSLSSSSKRLQTAIHATSSSRRELLQNTLTGAFLASLSPSLVNAADTATYVTSIEQSTTLLSQSLGHAVLVIDGLNQQARRLGSSPNPAHPISVLDGMHAQAKRLTSDLDKSKNVLDLVKSQAKEIVLSDESLGISDDVIGGVAHASSVLDGMVTQSKRLEGASARGGSAYVDDEIIYMLSILDGLNAQVRRLDEEKTFGILDEINGKAARALL